MHRSGVTRAAPRADLITTLASLTGANAAGATKCRRSDAGWGERPPFARRRVCNHAATPGAGTDALADRPRYAVSPPRALRPPTAVPRAWADADRPHRPLRVDTGTYVADVCVNSVIAGRSPPGYPQRRPRSKASPDSSVTRADVSGPRGRVLNSLHLGLFQLTGVTPFADAAWPRRATPSDWLDAAGQRWARSFAAGCLPGRLPRPGVGRPCCWTRKPASTSHSGTFDLRLEIATAVTDADRLATVAAHASAWRARSSRPGHRVVRRRQPVGPVASI